MDKAKHHVKNSVSSLFYCTVQTEDALLPIEKSTEHNSNSTLNRYTLFSGSKSKFNVSPGISTSLAQINNML